MSFIPNSTPNILINPCMDFDQVKEGTSTTLASDVPLQSLDGWYSAYKNSTAVVTSQQVSDGPLTIPKSLKLTVSTGGTVNNGDYLEIYQKIEATNIMESSIGTVSAQPIALSFWLKSSIAPYILCGSIRNHIPNRSYPFNITISSAATWTKFNIVIPGDITGTWLTSDIPNGMYFTITGATGSTFQGTANTWSASNYIGTSSITNTLLSTNGATLQLTGAKLEFSPIPTPLVRKSYGEELIRCQRYYEKSYDSGVAVGTVTGAGAWGFVAQAGGTVGGSAVYFKVTKRTGYTLTTYSTSTGASGKLFDGINAVDINSTVTNKGMNAFDLAGTIGTGTNLSIVGHWTADSRL